MDNEPIIAFDESGNTGSELLNKNQPVFVLSSVKLSIQQATELKSIIKSPATELKFNRLKKYHKYHSQFIELLNHDIISEETVKLAVFHKEYCLWVHTVDHLIEPFTYRNGFDLYENGLNIALTNLFYYCVPVLCDNDLCEAYKIAFINLFKKRDEQSISIFYNTILQLINSSKTNSFKEQLFLIYQSRQIIENILKDWDDYNFDSTLSGFMNLVDYWGRKTDEQFYAYVDDSKPLSHFKHYVDKIKNINIEQQIIGTDRRTFQLPLKLIDIKFQSSKENVVVQIADLIAGAANHYYRSLADPKCADDLSRKIGETKIIDLLHSPVWPHKAFTPEDLQTENSSGTNLLDSLVNLS